MGRCRVGRELLWVQIGEQRFRTRCGSSRCIALPGAILVRVRIVRDAANGNARELRCNARRFHLEAEYVTHDLPSQVPLRRTLNHTIPRGNQAIVYFGEGGGTGFSCDGLGSVALCASRFAGSVRIVWLEEDIKVDRRACIGGEALGLC